MRKKILLSFILLFFCLEVRASESTTLLISVDGYRYDYTEMYTPSNILNAVKNGVCSKGLIPPFPSFTYPSHLSMITGLYPSRHGIVSGDFYQPKTKKRFQLRDRKSVRDPFWYSGNSLWGILKKEGSISADYFWPGGETRLNGVGPSMFFPYVHSETHEKRIDQVIEWLERPLKSRPRLITLYFHDVDSAGNKFGPKSKEVGEAIRRVDESLGKLFAATKKLRINVNYVLVSDHGMKATDPRKIAPLYKYTNLSSAVVLRSETMVNIYSSDEKKSDQMFSDLRKKGKEKYYVFRYPYYPKKFEKYKHHRLGDVVVVSKGTYSLKVSPDDRVRLGVHGYHPEDSKEMMGVFCAWGPKIKRTVSMPRFESVDVFPFVASLLDIETPKDIDGSLKILRKILKD